MIHTVVDQIRSELRHRIMSGAWRLGSRIFEEDIAAELEVSRSAVREAIRLLEQEGLIVREAHRGLYVASPSSRDALEAAQLRAVLEAEAVRLSPSPTPAQVSDLEDVLWRFERVEEPYDPTTSVQLDRTFHSILVQGCRNGLLLRKFHELDGQMAIFFHWFMSEVPERSVGMAARHRLVLEAFKSGDPDAFGEAIEEHYRDAIEELARHLPDTSRESRALAQRAT
jgi:DNA-binding GntR family transcriptional regulator